MQWYLGYESNKNDEWKDFVLQNLIEYTNDRVIIYYSYDVIEISKHLHFYVFRNFLLRYGRSHTHTHTRTCLF